MDGGPADRPGWFDNALAWARRAPLEVTVKNVAGQIAKEFYGYGPRGAVRCRAAGRLLLYATPLSGSAVLGELAARPAGRVLIEYNNRLLAARCRETLGRLAERALGNRLECLFIDFDEGSGAIVGGALFRDPVENGSAHSASLRGDGGVGRCAPSGAGGPGGAAGGFGGAGGLGGAAGGFGGAGAEAVAAAIGRRADAGRWSFRSGPEIVWGWGPSLTGDPRLGADPGGEWDGLERLREHRERREGLAADLRAAMGLARSGVVFVGDDGRLAVAGWTSGNF